MAESYTIDRLLPEIQTEVLCNADSPATLHNIIKSSPRLFQVFKHNKAKILSSVGRRQFDPAVLPEALTFAKISQLEAPLSKENARRFSDIDSTTMTEWAGETSTVSESTALCQLANNIDFFMNDFAQNTLPILAQLGQSQKIEILTEYTSEQLLSHPPLSKSEISKLQRALCRFEVYRYANAQCSAHLDHDTRACRYDSSLSSEEQATLYLRKLSALEIAEMNCIRDYLCRRLRGVCTQLETEAVSALSPEDFVFDGDPECAVLDSDVFLFTESRKSSQRDHIEHLMSLGLSYIRKILTSSGKQNKHLFVRCIPNSMLDHLETTFLTSAIKCLDVDPFENSATHTAGPPSPRRLGGFEEEGSIISSGWNWAYADWPPLRLYESVSKGFRDWGYVFWDHKRLLNSGMLERSPFDVRQTSFVEYLAARGPSVEERLCGRTPIPGEYYDEDGMLCWDSEYEDESFSDQDSDLTAELEEHMAEDTDGGTCAVADSEAGSSVE